MTHQLVLKKRVGDREYHKFNCEINFNLTQISVVHYLDEQSQEEFLIKQLRAENEVLKKLINEQPTISPQSGFLKQLVEASRRKLAAYSEPEKMIGLYLFLTGGRTLYETLYLNLNLPSRQTVLKYLHDSKTTKEGDFNFAGCAKFIKDHNYFKEVWVKPTNIHNAVKR